ncbi:PREDICTED: malignant fibrous histiocytoma-amplified sequence 1 homolog [Branchiostoma belcheri]|uniref:non-specific serine/threonine protein kinase n=1 Tax=Branchiostoma belcheri TaxID=7741 RepID=A0A6P4ZSA5_BRABE|nr:PREDICTED: malignant fibrous histiocytoma-amplified sequence 1 homolog [Branchiostoma belcheri]
MIRQSEVKDHVPQSGLVDESRVEDVSPQQEEQDTLKCPICSRENCDEDHESTFLFNVDQYKDHSNDEHIKLTGEPVEGQSFAIFKEIKHFKRLRTVTIIGFKLDECSLSHLFQCTTIRSLKLSQCQLAQVPRSLANLKDLEILDLSHNRLVTLPSWPIRLMPCLKSLNVSHNKITVIGRVVKTLRALNALDLCYNDIEEIPFEILEMESLEAFSCSNNKIQVLPPLDPANVSQNIEFVDLSNNKICEGPSSLLLIRTLKTLLLGGNQITTLPSDLDLNNLSPMLRVIDLSDNRLKDIPLPLCFLPSLEELDLKQNKINTISANVRSCKSLSVLDVSRNRLNEIPSHVTGLPSLVEIHASNNQINSVSPLQRDESSVLEVIDLASNSLFYFPEALIQMERLKKVDLSYNGIRHIPESIMGMRKDVKLYLRYNPIIDPPLQVCQAGLSAIQAFYEDLTTESSITQCLKTLFLGAYEAGKTSLVRALQMNRSSLTKPEERTHGIDIAELLLSAPNTPDITLSVWDFAGQETYYITHQFFLSAKALVLLIVDLKKYDSVIFDSTCGKWLENMIAKVGNPVVIPVVTHIDKLSGVEVRDRCDDLARKLADQERTRIEDLRRQLKRINESHLGPEAVVQTVKDRKKQIESLLEKMPTIHPKPVPVSSAESLEGTQYLKQVILNYAVNKEYFPEVGRPVPKAWADTEACVERKGKELSFPYMTWDEFTALLKENVPNLQPESRIKTVAQYLHDTGKILWYSEIESLRNHVFLKPSSLVDIFRKVIRHDLETVINYSSDPCYREAEISQGEFQKMKNDLIEKGILHTKLLRCLWSDVEKNCRSGTFNAIFQVLIELMRQFDLCYDIEEQQERELLPRERVLRSEALPQSSQRLLLPWHIKDDMGDMAKAQWESGESPIISLQYQFPSFIPPGLFARLTVRAHRPKHNLHFVLHWKTGTLCKHKRYRIMVLLKYEAEGQAVSLSARPESPQHAADVTVNNLWETLKPLSMEVEDLLKQWPGVWFDRLTVCPKCHQPSFPGNWLHPSSTQPEEICSLCHERVSVEFLMPPTPPSLDNIRVSDRQLLRVAKKLGAEWESLAIHMGFTPADVYKFKYNHPHNMEQQIFTMLTTWRNRKGGNSTRQNLQRYLREAKVDHDTISSLDDYEIPEIVLG